METERQNQALIGSQNEELRQQISRLESDLEALRAQNQYEYESVQNDRINDLNQTIDDLRKQNLEMTEELQKNREILDNIQNSSAKQFDELLQKSNNEKSDLNQQLLELQTTIDNISGEKQRFEYAYYELQNRFQEFDRLMQNKNLEIGINYEFLSKIDSILTQFLIDYRKFETIGNFIQKDDRIDQ